MAVLEAGYKPHNRCSLLFDRCQMKATFCLGSSRPAAGTGILSCFYGIGAGPAPNAWIPVIMQRIVRKLVGMNMLPHLLACACRQSLQFDHLVCIITLD